MRRLETSKIQRHSVRSNKGFSLIELLVVVAVILIIAAIAIPNFIQSKMRANEASAVRSLRNITTAQAIYSTMYGIGFSDSLAHLSGNGIVVDQNSAGLIDEALAGGIKSGYIIRLTVLSTDPQGNVGTYSVTGDPQVPGSSGQSHFYSDQTMVIRFNVSAPAGPSDPPIS